MRVENFVWNLKSTNLLLCASSPDCTPPFKLEIVDSLGSAVIDVRDQAEGAEFTHSPFWPLKTQHEIVFMTKTKKLKSKRIANWTERIERVKNSYGLQSAIKLVIKFYKEMLVGTIGLGETPAARKSNAQSAFLRLMAKFLKKSAAQKISNDHLADFVISVKGRQNYFNKLPLTTLSRTLNKKIC